MPELVNPLAGYRDAYNLLEGQAQDGARRQAGNALAGGNYQGAQDALYGRGMLDEGLAVQQRQFGVQDRQAGQQEAERKRQGDTVKQALETYGNINEAMAGVPAERRADYFRSQVVPRLQGLPGATPEAIAQLSDPSYDWSDEGIATNRALIGRAVDTAKAEYEFVNLGAGGVGRGNKRTGDYNTLRDPDPRYEAYPQNQDIFNLPRGREREGGGASPRSPEVGQYIMGRLQGIPGLKLGSASPRSEAEIAGLPLSARDTYHRQGAALDLTAPGMKPDAVIALVRERVGPGYDVIYHPENDSYHVEPGPNWSPSGGPARGSGPQLVRRGMTDPTAGSRPATAEEKAAYGVSADTPAAMEDGKFKVLTAAVKANALDGKEVARRNAAIAKAMEVTAGIDKAVGLVSWDSAGYGAFLDGVPGSKSRALKAQIDFIKANIGFDALQEMRANSPTGGALGQVAVQELSYLQASLASLDTKLSEEELKAALSSVKRHYTRYMQILKQEQEAESAGGMAPAAPPAPRSYPGGRRGGQGTRGKPSAASGMSDADLKKALGL
jgi:hypothetical protein